VGKSHATQVFLTPKEKYAKEVSAERKLESVQRRMTFDVEAADVFILPTTHCPLELPAEGQKVTCSLPPFTTAVSPLKAASKIPLTSKILQAKKKMAIQKKHILEHGEVRLTQEQRSKLKPLRKRAIRAAKQTASAKEETGQNSSDGVVIQWHRPPQLTVSETTDHRTKRIFNRKDKLLAEHRSRQVPAEQPEPPRLVVILPALSSHDGASSPQVKAKQKTVESLVKTCEFCSVVSATRKELYKHVKVRVSDAKISHIFVPSF